MLLSNFTDSIGNLTVPLNELPNSLLLQKNQSLNIYYALFDYINLSEKIALQNVQQQLSINDLLTFFINHKKKKQVSQDLCVII